MDWMHYSHGKPMTLTDFLRMNEETAVQFDFLTQGVEPDRCSLMESIYQRIFPWYDNKLEAGDTLNTYRIAIRKYYGRGYRYLRREEQLRILDIIRENTSHSPNQIFEIEETDARGNLYYQVCNNYQLGNFGVMPIRGGINPKRSFAPYLDFFDSYLKEVNAFYSDQLSSANRLARAIDLQQNYFKSFGSMSNFLDANMMMDFIREAESGFEMVPLSECKNFEEYVGEVTTIVSRRSKYIWHKLQESNNY